MSPNGYDDMTNNFITHKYDNCLIEASTKYIQPSFYLI